MTHPDLPILYVDKPAESVAFYRKLLGAEPVEQSPTFAIFVLANGFKLGLWSRHAVSPSPDVAGGGVELGFRLGDNSAVDALYRDWKDTGVTILQDVADMEFGRNFLGVDPDGHRLRVYCPPAA